MRIELPRPTCIGLVQRIAGDVVDHPRFNPGLGWNQVKVLQGGVEIGIRAGCTKRPPPGTFHRFRVGPTHRGVDDHCSGEHFAVARCGLHRHQAPERVTDDDRRSGEPDRIGYGDDFPRPLRMRVPLAVTAVSVSTEVECDHVIRRGEHRS